MSRPYLTNALGSYPDREEFQVGRVIVWVRIPSHAGRSMWLERADQLFEEVWQAVPEVLSAAERESRALIPEFWKAHDEAGTAGEHLAVRGIWIDPATGVADYEVGCNHDSENPSGLSELPDGYSILVSRSAGGDLLVRR